MSANDNSQTLINALAEIERLKTALNRYSADEVRLTKESTIAAQSAIISTLTTERDALKQDAKRYETVRRMNPRQFAELYRVNVERGIKFDALVDNAKELTK